MPARKKAKIEMPPAKLESLSKVLCKLPHAVISPGALQGCRVAVMTSAADALSTTFFVTSGTSVYTSRGQTLDSSHQARGLDGISLPAFSQEASVAELDAMKLPTEVQSITLAEHGDESLLAAVDLYGTAKLMRVDTSGATAGAALRLCGNSESMEAGWVGIAVSGGITDPLVTTASCFGKAIEVFQAGQHLRTLGTIHQPHALASVNHGSGKLFAIAEGPQNYGSSWTSLGATFLIAAYGLQICKVSLWDVRVAEKRGCTGRLSPGGSNLPLFCIATDTFGNFVAAGGAESAAVIFDVRRLGLPVARWPSCLKHDVVAIHFLLGRFSHVIVGGSDQEIRCGLVDGKKQKAPPLISNHSTRAALGDATSFRLDDRLLGMHRAAGSNTLACFAASKSVLLAHFAFEES